MYRVLFQNQNNKEYGLAITTPFRPFKFVKHFYTHMRWRVLPSSHVQVVYERNKETLHSHLQSSGTAIILFLVSKYIHCQFPIHFNPPDTSKYRRSGNHQPFTCIVHSLTQVDLQFQHLETICFGINYNLDEIRNALAVANPL